MLRSINSSLALAKESIDDNIKLLEILQVKLTDKKKEQQLGGGSQTMKKAYD